MAAPAALGALMLLDLTGLVRGWAFFDHAAHLAGAVLGVAYVKLGLHTGISEASQLYWRKQAQAQRQEQQEDGGRR